MAICLLTSLWEWDDVNFRQFWAGEDEDPDVFVRILEELVFCGNGGKGNGERSICLWLQVKFLSIAWCYFLHFLTFANLGKSYYSILDGSCSPGEWLQGRSIKFCIAFLSDSATVVSWFLFVFCWFDGWLAMDTKMKSTHWSFPLSKFLHRVFSLSWELSRDEYFLWPQVVIEISDTISDTRWLH